MTRDKLLVRGLRLFGRHGVLPEEKVLGQPFVVNVDIYADLRRAGKSDNFQHTLDYVRVVDVTKEVIHGKPRNLVEKVATDIAKGVFKELPQAQSVRVEVTKPHVAIPHNLKEIGVEIWRDRQDVQDMDRNDM